MSVVGIFLADQCRLQLHVSNSYNSNFYIRLISIVLAIRNIFINYDYYTWLAYKRLLHIEKYKYKYNNS